MNIFVLVFQYTNFLEQMHFLKSTFNSDEFGAVSIWLGKMLTCIYLVICQFSPIMWFSLDHDNNQPAKPAASYFRSASNVISQGSWMHSAESSNCPLPHTWPHRCLMSLWLMLPWQRIKPELRLMVMDICVIIYWAGLSTLMMAAVHGHKLCLIKVICLIVMLDTLLCLIVTS